MPKASGEYNRVINGDANKVINCAPAVPPTTMRMFRINLFCDSDLTERGKISKCLASYIAIIKQVFEKVITTNTSVLKQVDYRTINQVLQAPSMMLI
tara:strand:- start:817 stop:1107 length:291 start_codon:yes stop_codon:yes gene_type:complete